MGSLWLDPPLTATTDALEPGTRADLIVVGAGLTGLTTAILAAERGREVIVLEARHLGAGTTGHTTAKVSLLQGTVLSGIRSHADDAELGAYVAANRLGQEWLLGFLRDAGARVETRDAWTYAVTPAGRGAVGRERDAARAAGLQVEESLETGLPFEVTAALRLPDQAQIHAGEALTALADRLRAAGGRLVTGARVVGVDAGSPVTVKVLREAEAVPEGEPANEEPASEEVAVTARQVVLATGTPILDRGLHFARLEPLRSYALSFAVPGPVPTGMYLSVDQPNRSVRTATLGTSTELLVGGEGHVVGRGGSTRQRVAAITAWTQQHFPGARPTHQWSAQDYRSTRRLPLAGRMPGTDGAVFLATGFNKWGMTNAVAAAMALAGDLEGERPQWANELYGHVDGATDVADGLRVNVAVAARLARGWAEGIVRSATEQPPAEGSGVVGRSGAGPVATSTVDGRTCAVSAVCTHLGGVVQWNDAELTWDCPLHGSRFAADGRRLEGPAVRDLGPRPEAVEE